MSAHTETITVDPHNPDPAVLERAGALVRAGRLVAFPTETVYGIGTNAFDAEAVSRIFAAKGRAANDPIIVHVAALDDLQRVAAEVPPIVHVLAARFWPGPLTLVLPRGERVPLNVTAGLDTVAVRMPAHPVAFGLITAAGVPVAAPSANLFTRPSATLASHVVADLAGWADMVLDAGPATFGVESTVLDLTGEPRILRPGALTLEQLRAVLPHVRQGPPPATGREAAGQASPGLMPRHYSPHAEMLVYDGDDVTRVLEALSAGVEEACRGGRRVALLLPDEDLASLSDLAARLGLRTASLGPEGDLAGQARRLFAAIRLLDQEGVEVIATRMPPPEGLGLALRDRLRRSASGRVLRAGPAE